MKDTSVKVGFCVAYDWRLLAHAIPPIYDQADKIYLSIDNERVSWARKAFRWDQRTFNEMIRSIDTSGKIVVYEDNFHIEGLTPAQNEIRQRQMMAEKMGEGGWQIQLDCDEYFLNFSGFVNYLKQVPSHTYRFNVCCQLITLFKEVPGGFLYVYPENAGQLEFLQIASQTPKFDHGRRNGYFNILAPFLIVHQSWARSEDEILEKLSNWGHVHDFDAQQYFEFWKNVNAGNFADVRSFHPIKPGLWPRLRLMQAEAVNELVGEFSEMDFPTLAGLTRFLRNSIFVSRLKNLFRLFYRIIYRR